MMEIAITTTTTTAATATTTGTAAMFASATSSYPMLIYAAAVECQRANQATGWLSDPTKTGLTALQGMGFVC